MSIHNFRPALNAPDWPSRQDYLQVALEFRAWNFATFALNASKRPAGKWRWLQDQRPTDRQISRMFDRSYTGGVAVVLGSASGGNGWVLCCRDWDDLEAYRRWVKLNPELAAVLPTVETPGRGAHTYCRLRGPDLFVKLDDGELRASKKCYVALPPSRHPSGDIYRWTRNSRPTSIRDFPILDIESTGFLPNGCFCRQNGHSPTTSHTGNTFNLGAIRGKKPLDPPNGLCPKSRTLALNGLPPRVREAVLRTLPSAPRERNSKLFYLARSLADVRSGVPAEEWTPSVFAWWLLSLATIRTKPWAATWKDFANAWARGQVPISSSRPVRVMTEAAVVAGPDRRARLLAACQAKAADSSDGTFYLSIRMASTVTGIPRTTVNKLLQEFAAKGVLRVLERGLPSPVKRRATYYHLVTSDTARFEKSSRHSEPTAIVRGGSTFRAVETHL